MTELEQELELLQWVGEAGGTKAALCRVFKISPMTFNRRIEDLRNMGADIRPRKGPGKVSGWTWEVANWEKVKDTTKKWLVLEKQRNELNLASADRDR